MPKWWKNLDLFWKLTIEIATIGAFALGGYTIYQTYWHHKDDQEQHERELTAELVQAGEPFEKDGYIQLLFRNKSPQGKAIVSTLWFVINDPMQLKMIERAHPKPLPPKPGETPMCGAMIPPENAFFRDGQWHNDNEFAYSCYEPHEAGQMDGILLKLAIFDDKLASQKLTGVVVLDYNDEQQVESRPLSLACRRETPEDPTPQQPRREWKWFRPFRR